MFGEQRFFSPVSGWAIFHELLFQNLGVLLNYIIIKLLLTTAPVQTLVLGLILPTSV